MGASMGASHYTNITCPWGWGGSKYRSYRFLPYMFFLLPPGAFYLLPSHTITCECNETQNLYSCSCCLSSLFICLFVFNFDFVLVFELFNLLLIIFIYFIYLFIYFLHHNFLGMLDLFPSFQLTKILDSRLCYICHHF